MISRHETGEEWFAPNKGHDGTGFDVDSDALAWFDDHHIVLPGGVTGEITAEIEIRIVYGRPGRMKYSMTLRKHANFCAFPNKITGLGVWYDKA